VANSQYSTQARDPLVINPGELLHSIAIQAPSTSPDTFGQSITPTSWSTILTSWAAIYTAGGKETSMASQIVSEVSHVVKIRWSAAVTVKANQRVLFGSRTFTVQYVENVKERNRVLLLYCLEVDGGGA
jgi:SPP1 family predicted phage head-tail adaptor